MRMSKLGSGSVSSLPTTNGTIVILCPTSSGNPAMIVRESGSWYDATGSRYSGNQSFVQAVIFTP